MNKMPSTSASSHSSEERSNQQRVDSLSPLDAVIVFLITTLGGYLQIEYHSRNISPFDEHGNILKATFLTLFMYAMGLMAQFKLRTHNSTSTWFSITQRFNPLIGILVVISLLIILFPLLGLTAFILWALLMVEASIKSFQEIYQWFSDVIFSLQEVYRWFSDIFSRQEVYRWFSDIISRTRKSNFNRNENSSIGSEENDSNAREENELPV